MAAEPETGPAFDVFISYSHADADWVRRLAEDLRGAGLEVFLDEWEIRPGDVAVQQIQRALETSRSGIVVCSAASMASQWVRQEMAAMVQLAAAGRIRLIPVLISDVELPPLLADRMWIDFRDVTGPAYERRVRELVGALRDERAPSRTAGLWHRLSSSSRAALGWAAAFSRPQEPPLVVTELLLLGLTRADDLAALVTHFGHTLTELVESVRSRYGGVRFDATDPIFLQEVPQLSANARAALLAAQELADDFPNERREISPRHVLGGLLRQRSSVAYGVLATVLHEVDLAEIAAGFVDFLRRGPEAHYGDFLVERFPVRSTPRPKLPPSSFAWREPELARLERALDGFRPLVVVTGRRGAGKTALVRYAASRLADRFPDGIVEVSWADDPNRRESVIAEVASQLGGPAVSGAAALESLLAGRRVLLIFDDVPDDASLEDLLPAPPSAAIVIGMASSPPAVASVIALDGLSEPDAVSLLTSLTGGDGGLTEEDAAAARRVVLRADGLPGTLDAFGAAIAATGLSLPAFADWLAEPAQAGLDAEALAEVARRALGAFSQFRQERAGYACDTAATEDTDRLDFHLDVHPLCNVIMAQDVKPPLSIGLFGDWGSGKSSFMQLMQARIDRIARDAAAATGKRDVAFCTEVRQIRFNAWHYADANLWASLIIHFFEELSSPSGPAADLRRREVAEAERRHLAVRLETQQRLRAEAISRRDQAEKERGIRRRALGMLRSEVEAAIADDEQVKEAAELIKDELGVAEVSPKEVQQLAHELTALPGQLRKAVWLLTRGREILPLALGVAAGLAVALGTFGIGKTGVLAWAAGIAVGSIGAVVGFVAGPLAIVRGFAGVATQAADRIEELRRRADERRAALQVRVDEAEESVREVEREIQDIEAGRRLRRFIEDRSRSTDYLSHLGIISLIRRDFEELSRLLEDNRRARLEGRPQPHDDLPPIDRIVLYIDDLDRCSAAKVVEVLEAVHLLLAFDIFVVVVGVDPRWLVRSLQLHYSSQLGAGGALRQPRIDGDWIATPHDYLEKIFQIPLALPPMGVTGYQVLVGSLLPVMLEPSPALSVPSVAPAQPDVDASPPAEPETPAGATGRPTQQPEPIAEESPAHLDPENLRVYEHELEFVKQLSVLITTPRAAKRLINTYRLLRASLPEAEFRSLVRKQPPGDYAVVLLLLATIIGFPQQGADLFTRLLASSATDDFWTVIAGLKGELGRALRAVPRSNQTGFRLDRVKLWIPRVARYSFQTARLAV